jgi:hypothetical protein
MRHRASRPTIDLRHRVRRAIARLLSEAASLRPGRALVALLVVVVGLGIAAYGVLTSVSGGSSTPQAASVDATTPRDAEQQESRDSERSDPTAGLPSDDPTASASSSPSRTPSADSRAERGVTASPAPDDHTEPNTSLSASYPTGDAATFTLGADEAATFACSLDGAAYTPCDSPMRYSGLAPGWHTFAVRATDSAGNIDPSPATTRWHARDGRSPSQ